MAFLFPSFAQRNERMSLLATRIDRTGVKLFLGALATIRSIIGGGYVCRLISSIKEQLWEG